MGRPRLYNTAEEKRLSNNVKSKRSYNRNKTSISARRSTRYRQKADQCVPPTKTNAHTTNLEITDLPRDRHMSYWAERVEHVARKLTKAVGPGAYEFIEELYQAYIVSKDDTGISDAITHITTLQASIRRYQAEILQLGGLGKEWTRSDEVSNHVTGVLRSLEDLHGTVLIDPHSLRDLHHDKQLLYQT
ncbi:hypothetical protein FPV67DRAFT_1667889 [Lyophyllum atratum]|nr:hypothetical protein FPV67DRAFT_1679298 [Lyophyllum atratum]KAF8069988.1 hypothetical protein FPV67DRAFT_1667889 [Lyophyllum atratum]